MQRLDGMSFCPKPVLVR
uniref:Uncharacterized protein n=1 Tax=Zea mays TaxID=4577 RepID=B4FLW6_MAIZE|nr:unknown [Zea mays]